MDFFQSLVRVTVLFHVLGMISHVLSASQRQKEQVFSDVLKNITLANKILQDLLKNYERIEKNYQLEELLQSNSSSSEIPSSGQSFKSVISSKEKFKHRDKSHKKHANNAFKGSTIMMYASESVENLPEGTKQDIKEENTYRKPVKSHLNDAKYKKEVSKKVLNTNFFDNTELKEKNKSKNKAQLNESSSVDVQSDEVEQIIIEIPDRSDAEDEERDKSDVNLITNPPHERKIKSYSNKSIENILGEKTRFSIKHTAPNKKGKVNISKDSLRTKNNARRIKKVVYSEKFSPDKIWHEIINKPVRLKKDEEVFRKPHKNKNHTKITVLILKNNKKVNEDYKVETKLPKSNAKEVLSKLNLLSEVLRSEYGETCLQMPIKKCKKALKIVNKNICKRHFKCKSDFKSDFIQNSKDGCNKEFAYREGNANNSIKNNKIDQTYSPPKLRQLQKKSSKNKMEQRNIEKLQHNNFISLRNDTPKDAFLRFRRRKDKYEKKCQKESTKKCNAACEYAIKETCSVHTCEKRKKKALKGECKNQCKKAYDDVGKRVKSSSKSASDSDTESETDSDSD